jgi:hypothetical protein
MTFWDGTRWVPDPQLSPPRPRHRVARHVFGAAAEGALITALVFGFIAGSAFAAKGGNGATHTNGGHKNAVTISVPDGVFASAVQGTVSSPGLWVHATCTQSGATVYAQWVQTDGNGKATLTLGPTPMWAGGSASCSAEAGTWSSNGRWSVQATTGFDVSG